MPEWDDVAVGRWIRKSHRALVDDLTAVLEVETGLREAMIPAHHDRLVADLAAVLDHAAGLAAIGPIPSDAEDGSESTSSEDRLQRVSTVTELIDALSGASPAMRLSLRVPVRRLALDLTLLDDLALARERGRALTYALEDARGSIHAHTREHAVDQMLDRAHDVALALAQVLDRARDGAHAPKHHPDSVDPFNLLAEHRNRADELVRAGDRAYTDDLAALGYGSEFALAPDLDGALSHASAFARELDSDLDRTLQFVRDLAFDVARDLAAGMARPVDQAIGTQRIRPVELEQLIDTVRNFAGADLQELDLTGIPLDGVLWSDSTRWPEGWVTQIHDQSVAIGAGLYEIRPGTTTTDFVPASL